MKWYWFIVIIIIALIILFFTLKPIQTPTSLEIISLNIGIGSNMPQTNYER